MDLTYAVVTNDLQVASTIVDPKFQASIGAFLPRQIAFLCEARRLNIPIVHTQLIVSDTDDHPWNNEDRPVHGAAGSKMLESVLEPTDLIVQKWKDSAFFETDLDRTLKDLGANAVVITGMQAQICVQTTAADAHFRGYKVFVPSDGVVSTQSADAERALAWLASYCATVLTTDELIEKFKNAARGSGA